jgi:hypothetical protein
MNKTQSDHSRSAAAGSIFLSFLLVASCAPPVVVGSTDGGVCPAGQAESGGICCPTGTLNDNGVCCAPGTFASNGRCCPQGTAETKGLCCPAGPPAMINSGGNFCIDTALQTTELSNGEGFDRCASRGARVCSYAELYLAAKLKAIPDPGPNFRTRDIFFSTMDSTHWFAGADPLNTSPGGNTLHAPPGGAIAASVAPQSNREPFYCCY